MLVAYPTNVKLQSARSCNNIIQPLRFLVQSCFVLCLSLLIIAAIVSLATDSLLSQYCFRITIVRMSVSYQQPLKPTARSIQIQILLATRQVETMPGAQDLQVHSPHRCDVHLFIKRCFVNTLLAHEVR
jgi:hypothetical protein